MTDRDDVVPPATPEPDPASETVCSYCRRPFEADEPQLLLMRDGSVAAVYHERCHPHHRRSGCAGC